MWTVPLLLACGGGTTPGTATSGLATAATADSGTPGTSDTSSDATPDEGAWGLLSLNLHCLKLDGTSFASGAERWEAIAAEVERGGADVLALQEVCVQSGGTDALAELQGALEGATGDTWQAAYAFAHVAWEGTPDEADEGVALLSRVGLEEPTELGYVDPGALRRVGLFARLDDGTVVATVHLDVDAAASREAQARQTASQVLAAAGTLDVVIAGDLNDRLGSPTHGAFGSMGYDDASDGLATPRIDYAFAHRGGRWAVADQALWFVGAEAVSDHPGVFVAFEERVPDDVPVTRVVAEVDVGFGHTVSVRGDTEPLSWDQGWWAWPVQGNRWELVLTEVDGSFVFKTLVDDVTWQSGDDVPGEAGRDNVTVPVY